MNMAPLASLTPLTDWHKLHATLAALSQDRRQNTACTVLLCQWTEACMQQAGATTDQVNGWIKTILRGAEQLIECHECASALVLFDLDATQIEAVSVRFVAALAQHDLAAQVSTAHRVSGEPVQGWLRRLGIAANESGVSANTGL